MDKKQARLCALKNQVERLKRCIERLERRSDRYSWVRLAIFVIGLLFSILVFFLVMWWVGLVSEFIALVIFAIVATYHSRIDSSITRHQCWLHIKSTQIARMQLDWNTIPGVRSKEPSSNHPFATDLDITGSRSLHQLINTAISREGTLRLQDWLLNTNPDLQVIRKRQALIQELAPLTNFRDKLTLISMFTSKNMAEQWEGKRLLAWLEQSTSPRSLRSTLLVAAALAVLTLVLFGISSFGLISPQFWVISLLVALGWFFIKRQGIGDLFENTTYLSVAFAKLNTIFEYLETYPYGKHPHLKKLCEPFFLDREHSPSKLLRRLSRITWAATLQKNRLLWIIVNALVPWDIYFANRLYQNKKLVAAVLPTWLDVWFELEALNSLASFAYLNPHYVLPDVVAGEEQGSHVLFHACGLGHPLIPDEKKVVNDFTMDKLGEIRIITGSNMSGKSTFLRTLGINLCLAYAGGPVNASIFQTALFRLFTCIRVSDSVTDGYSYFYAEVKRLKTLLSELEEGDRFPLFFLIDEIFKGTNNRERLLGSRAYIQALVGRNCLGAISTHDLELVKLADTFPQIKNYHFREEVIDGSMVFDYLLRPGPCPTTNALKIMQIEGLPVESVIVPNL